LYIHHNTTKDIQQLVVTQRVEYGYEGYRDGSICTHKHTPQYVTGFTAGCHDKNAGLLLNDENGFATIENTTRYPSTQNDTVWTQSFYDAIIDTTFCPAKTK
jgi:hypothetical protein